MGLSYSGIESIECALKMYSFTQTLFTPKYHFIYPNITFYRGWSGGDKVRLPPETPGLGKILKTSR